MFVLWKQRLLLLCFPCRHLSSPLHVKVFNLLLGKGHLLWKENCYYRVKRMSHHSAHHWKLDPTSEVHRVGRSSQGSLSVIEFRWKRRQANRSLNLRQKWLTSTAPPTPQLSTVAHFRLKSSNNKGYLMKTRYFHTNEFLWSIALILQQIYNIQCMQNPSMNGVIYK